MGSIFGHALSLPVSSPGAIEDFPSKTTALVPWPTLPRAKRHGTTDICTPICYECDDPHPSPLPRRYQRAFPQASAPLTSPNHRSRVLHDYRVFARESRIFVGCLRGKFWALVSLHFHSRLQHIKCWHPHQRAVAALMLPS